MDTKFIEKKIKRFFKQKPQFKRVYTLEESDACVFISKNETIISTLNDNSNLVPFDNDDNFFYFFIKNKNIHDGKRSSYSIIKRRSKIKS